jgi:hypothetical protein
MHYKSFFH